MRDDFTERTKRILAARAGNRCSNPLCRKMTSGPAVDPNSVTTIGEAAHIKAASPGGKRYDSTMTPSERKSIENGIWLCESCAKLIDTDEKEYTVLRLNEWKDTAEAEARREVRSFNRYNIFDNDIDILKFVTVCFYRPAFMDNIHDEGNMEDLEKAIEDTAFALNTGILKDRNGNTIEKGASIANIRNLSWRNSLENIVSQVYYIQRILEVAKYNGWYEQNHNHSGDGWYIFHNSTVADELNEKRKHIIEELSYILRDAGLPELRFGNRQYSLCGKLSW